MNSARQHGSWADMYDKASLVREKPRLERRIREMYEKGIRPHFGSEEEHVLGRVMFDFPLIGKDPETFEDLGPLSYYSGESLGQPCVTLPVLSLRFLEDLCTAYAWLHTRGYSLETIDEYVTMLRYKKASDFTGDRYPPPLAALQIPDDALADKAADDLSLRFRNSAYAFILLHELGHVLVAAKLPGPVRSAAARWQGIAVEEDADHFALDILHRTSTIPMGAILFFQAMAYFMPSKGQFKAEGGSDRDWEAYLRRRSTHPLTANRLLKMALHLEASAGRMRPGPDSEVLVYISARLNKICEVLEIEELQGGMAVVAHRADPSTLAPRGPGGQTVTPLERWCGGKP